MFFNGFLYEAHHTRQSQTDDTILSSTLAAWKFQRVPVNGDGNCLFTSVAMALIRHFQNGHVNTRDILGRIGVPESDSTNVQVIARALRSALVDEWLGENSDHYQGFSLIDIHTNATGRVVSLLGIWEM